jgi:hypothetical protein
MIGILELSITTISFGSFVEWLNLAQYIADNHPAVPPPTITIFIILNI